MDDLDRNDGQGRGDFPDEDGIPIAEGYDGPEGFDGPMDEAYGIPVAEGYDGPEGFGGPEAEGHDGPEAPEAVQAPPEATDWEAEAALYKEKFLRALAENENARRRQEKELSLARKYSSESILRDLIQVLENLHLALSYADSDDPAVRGLAEGVGMTVTDCLNRMADHGFRELKAAPGDAFDPNFQEAVGVEAAEGLPDNSVARMLSRGYMLHDRLLKPVKVNLVKNPA
ncbi:MAG: nucleotide exchange factor GrpE [Deltaproteobacteria bacterium]|jgi:molecular chaperone GrpE|nr:nucleotide exchange factor GrpE [Deltaproteobacteria bacterium]